MHSFGINKERTKHQQTVLDNHTAIDYQLLLHRHGCNGISQICCFNLSDERKSINEKLHGLRELTKHIHGCQGLTTWLWSFLTGQVPRY